MEITKSYLLDLTYKVNGAAIEVHKTLGPGLLESVYKHCLKQELFLRGINFSSEMIVPIHYKGIDLAAELRCDLFVENCLVLELKAIENTLPIHDATLLSYMKLLEAPKGILYNFHSVNLYKDGQRTFVNEFFKQLKEE